MSILFNNPLLGASGQGPSADLGDTIEQSLRFTGSQKLESSYFGSSNTFGSNWSISFWVKFAGPINTTRQILATGLRTAGGNYTILTLNNTVQGQLSTSSGSTSFTFNGRRFRDPSAWYHILMTNSEFYINGEAQSATSGYWSNFDGTDKFGFSNWTGSPNSKATMYLAEFHLLQTTLTPTDFGKTNEDGVWVPISTSFTAAQYGANGAHLTFDSSQINAGIAEDSAPIGASGHTARNDFTASGFDTADVGLYSPDTVSSTGSWYASSTTAAAAFDGSTSNFAQTNTSSTSQITFTPSTPIPYTSSVEVYLLGNQASINGGSYQTVTASQYNTIASGSGTITSISTQGSYGGTLGAIRVDGTILVDNTDNDVDYFDTPTSNYGTWNPLHTAEGNKGSFTDANLQTANGSGGDYIAPSTIACGDGHWYWEVRIDGVQSTGYPMIGIFDYESAKPEWGGGASNTEGCLYWTTGQFGAFVTQGSQSSYGATFTTGDIIGVEYNGSDGQLTFYKNGTSQGLATTVAASRRENMIPGVSAGNNGSAEVSVNFGQMDFIYTVPTGAKKLQTNNLPEPTIKNGSDHFRALTGTGANILAIAQGTNTSGTNWNDDVDTGFTNGLWWIKDRDNANQHQLVDSVRAGNLALQCPNNVPAATYVAPAGNSVAWCWNYNAADPTTNGFEIIDPFQVTSTSMTVPHQLGKKPEFIISKFIDSNVVWRAWNVGLTSGTTLFLSKSDAATASACRVDNVTNTNFEWKSLQSSVDANQNVIHYVWTSVPGHSAFGSYTGNSSTTADGPFIYTGFRPAWIMIKCSSISATNWVINDSTRSSANPVDLGLQSNETTGESSSQSFRLDFLSNGFKVRSTGAGADVNRGNLIYAAFAENPFGGENAPPATAR